VEHIFSGGKFDIGYKRKCVTKPIVHLHIFDCQLPAVTLESSNALLS